MKELHEIAMKAERAAEVREMEQKVRAENFQAKVAEQVPDVVTHYYFHCERTKFLFIEVIIVRHF